MRAAAAARRERQHADARAAVAGADVPQACGGVGTAVAAAPRGPAAYHEVASVPPGVFDEPDNVDVVARQVFAAWARRLPGAPRDASDRVEATSLRWTQVGRLVTTLEGRRFAWQTLASPTREAPRAPAVDVTPLDPWNPPSDLEALTRHTIACQQCAGLGRVACGRCGGAGTVTCAECRGAREY